MNCAKLGAVCCRFKIYKKKTLHLCFYLNTYVLVQLLTCDSVQQTESPSPHHVIFSKSYQRWSNKQENEANRNGQKNFECLKKKSKLVASEC